MFGLAIVLLLSSCQKDGAADYRNEFDAATDFPYQFQMQGDGIIVAPSEEGYYVLNDSFLFFADKQNMKPVLLDNRPENDCQRPSSQGIIENCHAYVKHDPSSRPKFLQYYKGKLYTLESGEVWGKDNENRWKTMLIELSKDGSSRKVVKTFDSMPRSIAIHRGSIYYTLKNYSLDSKASSQLMHFSLKGSKKPKPIYTGNESGSQLQDITPYGKNIYFYENVGKAVRVMRYDMENGTVTRMFTNDDGKLHVMQGFYKDRLVYVATTPIANGRMLRDKEHTTVYSSDLEGNNSVELPIERTFFSFYYASGSYFYARPVFPYLLDERFKDKVKDVRHELTVYDEKYNPVSSIDLSYLPMDHSFMIGDNRYMFVQIFNNGKITMQYLDKNQIGSGKGTFKPLLETSIP
ncbi:hypothetical protein [Cohnella cellulosilytica]|uniref:DUF5050 domain-containing protein n=2 Tax=Cohnella cellulosilytica TaxID=986710 RepID=A0ABW2FKA8_9BACL